MNGLFQPDVNRRETESSLRPILIGIIIMGLIIGALALIFRAEKKKDAAPPAYAASLKFSDLKTSAAQNFVGATVSYIDGTIANTGDKTVTHAVVQVTFRDDMGQTAQREELPVRVLRTGGPYDEAVDLDVSTLGPRQSKAFRLIFENISAQWNHVYPDLQLVQVTAR